MPLDRQAFETTLARMTAEGLAAHGKLAGRALTWQVLSATLPGDPCLDAYGHICGIARSDLSRHEEIALRGAEAGLVARAGELKAILGAAAPILDHDRFRFFVQAGVPGPTGVKVALSIHGHRLTPKAGLLVPTLVARLETLVARIGHLGRATQAWMVDDEQVLAPDGPSAYRLWAALAVPAAFDPAHNADLPVPTLSRVLDATEIHRSLAE